jgi:MFS family permease
MSSPISGIGREVAAALRDRDVRSFVGLYFLLFVVTDASQQALALYYRALGIPIAALGLAKSVGNALEAVAATPVGILADEVDRTAMATVAGLALGLALLAFPLAGGPVVLGGLVVGLALARLAFGLAVTPLIDETLEDGSEGLGWGLRDVGIYLGSAVGLALAGVVVRAGDGVRWVFPALVPPTLVLVGILWRLRAPEFGDRPAVRDLLPAWPPAPLDPIRKISRPGVLLRLLVVKFLVNFGMGASFYLVPVLALDLGLRAEEFLFALGVSNVLAAPLSVAGGLASDRLPRKFLYVGNWAVEALMLGAFALARGPLLFGVGIALFVVQTGFEPAVLAYFFDQLEDEESGRAWGISGTVAKGVGIVAPAVGGVLYGVDPHVPFAVGAVATAAGAAVAVTLPR